MINETSSLLSSTQAVTEKGNQRPVKSGAKASPWSFFAAVVLCVVLVSGVNAASSSSSGPPEHDESALSPDAETTVGEEGACVSMCTGVYTSICMAYGNENLPLPSGIMHANAISAGDRNGTGGIDYYLLSTDPDYLGLEWREHGHYELQDDKTPSPVENCAGSLDLQAWDGSEWIPFHFDMEWNTIDSSRSFFLSTAIGFNCHYTKIYGDECKEVHRSIVQSFQNINIQPEIPSADELCTAPSINAETVVVAEDLLEDSSSSKVVDIFWPPAMIILGFAFVLSYNV